MEPATYFALYVPMFILFFIILPQQRAVRLMILKKKKGRRMNMMNEVIKKYIGRNCRISTGTFGINVTGKIIDVNDNWIEVETKKGNELINAEFIQNIKIES